jgi:hypothetical protein
MAILHGDTAQWPKQQADLLFSRFAFLLALFSIVSGIFLGMALCQKNPLLSITCSVVGAAIIPFLVFALKKNLRELGKQRIRHWRGAQTEAFVAWIIQTDLDDSWHLFNSVKLQQSWDIDHILVGPGGIFAISTKSQRGCFSLAPDGTLLLNNQPTTLAKEALAQALELRSRLEALMGQGTPFVQSILAVPFAYTDLNEKSQTTWILHQENLADTLEAEAQKHRLPKPKLTRALHSIQTLAQNAEKLYRTKPQSIPQQIIGKSIAH